MLPALVADQKMLTRSDNTIGLMLSAQRVGRTLWYPSHTGPLLVSETDFAQSFLVGWINIAG